MLSKLRAFVKQQELISPGDHIICAVSGGADSIALLLALYLLKDEWQLQLSAVHFNHHLQPVEPDEDEQLEARRKVLQNSEKLVVRKFSVSV